jgi:hypothetical protein
VLPTSTRRSWKLWAVAPLIAEQLLPFWSREQHRPGS